MPESKKSAPRRKVGEETEKRILGLTPDQATKELAALYGRSKKLKVNVRSASYSNLAFVQVSPRDVFIDFIQAPGLPQGDEVAVDVIRVYLPPPAAKSLADVLSKLIGDLQKAGRFETVP